jgi:L-lactate utilization protein LutB
MARLQSTEFFDMLCPMSRVEMAVEKVRRLNENQAEALLEWLELRENREALRQRMDNEIDAGLQQLKQGEKTPGAQVHAEIRKRSQQRRAS